MSGAMQLPPGKLGRRGFPLRLYAAAFMVSLLTTVFSGWQSWWIHSHSEAMSRKHVVLTEDVGRIMLLDEALTMSARMAAATGDFSYEQRYNQFDPQLTTEIDEVRGVLPYADLAQFVAETDAANLALVKMERQAFALTHQGRGREATALLGSAEYIHLKKVYAGGMEKTVNAANALIEKDTQYLSFLSVWSIIASAVEVLVLLAVWLLALRSAHSWAAERRETEETLRKGHDELEARVEQRTVELSDSNERLRREISEHVIADAKVQRLTQLYAVLSQCNQAIVRCTRQEDLFPQVCHDAVQFGGFKMAWIGIVDAGGRTVRPVASFGEHAAEYLHDIGISIDADSTFGCGPTGISIRENRPFWCQDFQHDPVTAPWHERGARCGWGSSASLPLQCEGVIIGAFTLYSNEVDAFDEKARNLLVEMATDVSYALDNFARETKRKQDEDELQELFRATEQAHLALLSAIEDKNLVEASLRKLSLVVEQSPSAIAITDLEANIEFVNEAFLLSSGYSRAEVIGQNSRILHSGKTPQETYEELWAALTNGKPWKGEFYNKRKDGSEYVEFAIITPLHQPDGGITHYVAIKEDITERKRMGVELDEHRNHLEELVAVRTQELVAAKAQADAANTAKSDFLAAMSHEIRTPMNGVIGMIDVLQQSSLSPQQLKISEIIHDSAFALLAVIDDILDFSKIEAGKLRVENIAMSIDAIMEGVCNTLDYTAADKGVELTQFVDPALPVQVLGDPARLRQILVNLANNAIKFSCGQGRQAKVSIRAILKPEKNNGKIQVEFHVSDNGIGIDLATQRRLFAPFTQADTSTTRSFGGTGLGLVISRRLANMMDGDIALWSEPGRGSVFSVHLPFAPLPDKPESGGLLQPVNGLSCLVVGDAVTLADDLASYLAHHGAQVERASGPGEAQQWLGGKQAGLLVVVVESAKRGPWHLDELYAVARAQRDKDIRFVIIGRGKRRRCRREPSGAISVDADGMGRNTFLRAVAIAAGRIVDHSLDAPFSWAAATPATSIGLSREEARSRGRLILIAEDNEINQKVALQQLALLGEAADIARNGREALALWQSGDYAILLADMHMPEMDGYELTQAIRAAEADKSHIPIVAFTANALKGEVEHCLEVGMDDYLSKPVQLANLKAMLEKWLPLAANPRAQSPSREQDGQPISVRAHGGDAVGAAPVDVNVLKALVGDDAATIAEFLHDFRLSAEQIAAELRGACEAGQASTAGALAHKLKSSARSVGALALGELCFAMEKAGKAGDSATLMQLLAKFEQEWGVVEKFLRECE